MQQNEKVITSNLTSVIIHTELNTTSHCQCGDTLCHFAIMHAAYVLYLTVICESILHHTLKFNMRRIVNMLGDFKA